VLSKSGTLATLFYSEETLTSELSFIHHYISHTVSI